MIPARIIVIGASAGGVETVRQLIRRLPAAINASIFVVIHIPGNSPSLLAQIFGRATALPVVQPQNMEAIEVGKMYVAPPDYHMRISAQHIRLSKGTKVNNSRPSIDTLFSSAAESHKNRVIGVVLTGLLDDGSLGLAKVKRNGGIAIVQDPSEALYAQMPLNAIHAANCDYVLPIAEISELLIHLAEAAVEPVFAMDEHEDHENSDLEAADKMTASDASDGGLGDGIYKKGKPSVYSCPDCGGVLAEIDDEGIKRYICRVGHTYSTDWLLAIQKENVEKALWTALRALDESISLARRTAEQQSDEMLKEEYLEKADDYERQADILRTLLAN